LEKENGNTFNCAESVMIKVSRESPLPGFNDSCMRIASTLGGGFGGDGEICGAVSGAILCLALLTGTVGNEPTDIFKEKRRHSRSIISDFMKEFSKNWGTVQCKYLRAMDKGDISPCGLLRHGSYRTLCDEYVAWSAERISNIISDLEM
jgi:C_GCAxxG_C_C family probable redox protein